MTEPWLPVPVVPSLVHVSLQGTTPRGLSRHFLHPLLQSAQIWARRYAITQAVQPDLCPRRKQRCLVYGRNSALLFLWGKKFSGTWAQSICLPLAEGPHHIIAQTGVIKELGCVVEPLTQDKQSREIWQFKKVCYFCSWVNAAGSLRVFWERIPAATGDGSWKAAGVLFSELLGKISNEMLPTNRIPQMEWRSLFYNAELLKMLIVVHFVFLIFLLCSFWEKQWNLNSERKSRGSKNTGQQALPIFVVSTTCYIRGQLSS